MRALIIKTSSMGDLLHTLPAISDAKQAHPELIFDWAADEAFAEIPQWHTAVDRTIVTRIRHWRKHPARSFANGDLKRLYQQLRSCRYDYVIDAQMSLKSAALTRLAKGPKYGGDHRSTRERIVTKAYQYQYRSVYEQHAVTRTRKLFAQILDYPYSASAPDYQIDETKLAEAPCDLPRPYIVCVHSASWPTKQWPFAYWKQLGHWLSDQGYYLVFPWGNNEELEQAKQLAAQQPNSTVLPQCSLSQLAAVLKNADAAISCDTGLAHLAAALSVPNVTLYGPTNPLLIGTYGENQAHLAAEFACAPCNRRQCTYPYESDQKPACFTTIDPQSVWQALKQFLPLN